MKYQSSLLLFAFVLVSPSGLRADDAIPSSAKLWPELTVDSATAHLDDHSIYLKLDSSAMDASKVLVPRLCATIRSVTWAGGSNAEIKIKPVAKLWTFTWKSAPAGEPVLKIEFDTTPLLPKNCPIAKPLGDGTVMLHAWQASTYGEKILFEPQWYKNTVGYWVVPTDYAVWDLQIDQPGTYSVGMLQGCGAGQGGSDAVVSLRTGDDVHSELEFQTVETGHFQNFRWVHQGMLQVSEPGSYQLRIDAKRIAKKALFDVRAIHLVRQAKP